MMARYLLFVQCAPTNGKDVEFNQWYDERHLADICALPGILGARRLETAAIPKASPPQPYATIYELETDDPESVLTAIRAGTADGSIALSDALDLTSTKLWLYKQR